MSSLRFLWPVLACAITGLALYVTRGVLDQTVAGTTVVRFAMLPPWQALVGFTVLAALVLVVIDHLNAPRGTTTARRPRLGELVLPLFSLVVLLLPFLPIVPDRVAALQALAGPLGAIVWLSVAALQVWVLWQSRLITARAIEGWSVPTIAVTLFAAAMIVAGATAQRLTGTALFPSGDEPHYLIIAQSLWRDGDLRIGNNHQRGDYRAYYKEDLEPHYLTRGVDREIYSIHPIGISLVLAPIYALAGYQGTVWALIAMGALAAAVAWRWTVKTLNAPGAATFAWAAVALSAPFMFNTFTVYPEIAAALAVVCALTATLSAAPTASIGRWIAIGVAVAFLPWLSTKYAPMSAVLLLIIVIRLYQTGPVTFLRNPKVWAVATIYAISLAAWFAFFYIIWGNPLPTAPYGALVQTSPLNLRFGAPGLLFDQEYGLFAYGPVYVLAATGLYQMWRAGSELRRLAVEITVIFVALLATVGAFGIWWGGTSAPARPIASGLPLLMLPMAMAFRSAPLASPRRAAQHVLLWISIGIAFTLAVSEDGLLINNNRDGSSALLGFWLPRWELSSLAPTFVAPESAGLGWLHTLWWLVVISAATVALRAMRSTSAGLSALLAFATLSGTLLTIAVTMPLLPAGPPGNRIDLGARPRLAALDGFDTHVRPASVIYDPLHKGAAADVLPRLVLGVRPGQRSDPQPVRVIHNGRFSLPAGTYTIAIDFTDRAPDRAYPLSLQIGRNGPPLQTWSVHPRPGQRWEARVVLALDASFVGLIGDPELERAVAAITITPQSVVDSSDRPRVPVVLSAAAYSTATVYFHEEQMYPEPQGFWTAGESVSRMTVAVPNAHTGPVVLSVHSGVRPNSATFSTFGWKHTLHLLPGKLVDVELPMFPSGVIPLTIDVEAGFYPKDTDPASADTRFLGIWVEVKTPAAGPAPAKP